MKSLFALIMLFLFVLFLSYFIPSGLRAGHTITTTGITSSFRVPGNAVKFNDPAALVINVVNTRRKCMRNARADLKNKRNPNP